MSRVTPLVLLLIVLSGCTRLQVRQEMSRFSGSVVSSADLPAAIGAIRQAVVHVKSKDLRGNVIMSGTGFFVASNQLITCEHVIEAASYIEVFSDDGKEFRVAGVFAVDAVEDIAVLWMHNSPESHLTVRPTVPSRGETVYTIGAPHQLRLQTTSGHVVGAPETGPDAIGNIIFLSAPATPGCSGGPVLDTNGHVVGIMSKIIGAKVAGSESRLSIATWIDPLEPLRENTPMAFNNWRHRNPTPAARSYLGGQLRAGKSDACFEASGPSHHNCSRLRQGVGAGWSLSLAIETRERGSGGISARHCSSAEPH